MRHRVIALLLALSGLAAAPSAHAATGDFVVANRGFGVTILGPMRPRTDATKQAAIRAFGSAYRVTARCRYTWPAIGLSIQMTSFGGGDPCAYAQLLTISGPASRGWRTVRGLRVGASVATLRRLYPQARQRGALWTLTAARSPYADNQVVAVIWAVTVRGRVTAIRGWIGGAGD